jgi:hypothetical protein
MLGPRTHSIATAQYAPRAELVRRNINARDNASGEKRGKIGEWAQADAPASEQVLAASNLYVGPSATISTTGKHGFLVHVFICLQYYYFDRIAVASPSSP